MPPHTGAFVRQMNCIRFGGLLTAAACGLFGLRVLWVYRREGDTVFESFVRGHCSNAPLLADAAVWSGSGSGSESSPPTLVTTGTFAMFTALLFVVLSAIATGACGVLRGCSSAL